MFRAHTVRRLAGVMIILSLFFGITSGCSRETVQDNTETIKNPVEGETGFDLLMDELFIKYVTTDSITLNYSLANPEDFGIDKPDPPTLGEVTSLKTIRESRQENLELRQRLEGFRYAELRADQQIIYDMLLRDLEIMEVLESNEDYAYFIGAFYPIAGVHIQYPIIMLEFMFHTAEDIEIYLRLLEDTWRYFNDLIEFERERSRRGFFLYDNDVDDVISHCQNFLENTNDNFMIVAVNDKIDRFGGLTDEQREQFKQRNRELVLGYVLPAYEALLQAMHELRGVGAHCGGLSDLPDGRKFALAYLQLQSGSDIEPQKLETKIVSRMRSISELIGMLTRKDPALWDKLENGTIRNIKNGTPDEYLQILERAIVADYPVMLPTQYTVRSLHESMREFMSSAFYLLPAFDYFEENIIYINPAGKTDNLQMFTLLAHEGYPGHMYQTVYYLRQQPHPLRTVLYNLGYIEGWAVYAENRSYHYTELSEYEAVLLSNMRLFDMLFITRIDLGVNVLGKGVDWVASVCRDYGIMDFDDAEEIFLSVIGYPLHFMPYTVGYLEMISMQEEASGILGDDFSFIEFHRFILDFGPAPFSLLQSHLQDWIATQPSTAPLSAEDTNAA